MPFTYTNRLGKTYYLHTGRKRGGGVQHYLSTKPAGPLAGQVPEGFEIYETPNGQVYLRRQRPRLIHDAELDCIRRGLAEGRRKQRYQVEACGDILLVHESSTDLGIIGEFAPWLSSQQLEAAATRHAHYQPVLRFLLVDAERRVFAPERYCFRGSVDDWISIGPPASLEKLAAKYLKHLGQDSFFELY